MDVTVLSRSILYVGHTLAPLVSEGPPVKPPKTAKKLVSCCRRSRVVLSVVKHVRRMRGGAQSHLMRCSDGNCYVVKFQNNPQHVRVLANEMLASLLARSIGLSVPEPALVWVGNELVAHTPELKICYQTESVPCQPGLQFGSQYVLPRPWDGHLMDYFPVVMLPRIRNLREFSGMLAFDKWTGNTDARQAVYWRSMRHKKYTATFIDHGFC